MPLPDPAPPHVPARFERSRGIARRMHFDRAVLYVLLTRLWQLVAGPITLLLIARHFSRDEQGVYYAFNSLLAFQALFDLNVTVVLLIGAGRQWAQLSLDDTGGVTGQQESLEQLASLTRFGLIWYRVAALLCVLCIGSAGLFLFQDKNLATSDYAAWIVTILAASAVLAILPRLAVLQGCHQVLAVNRNLALQSISASLVVWASLIAGLGLWAIPASWLMRLAWDLVLVHIIYRRFFLSLAQQAIRAINWRSEVWPLQWRLALQAVSYSVLTASFVLALFETHSEAAAGRMGMTLSVLNMILWGGFGWVQTRVPQLAALGKRNERTAYNKLFFQIVSLTTVLVAVATFAAWAGLLLLHAFDISFQDVRLADRFTSREAFAWMGLGIVAQHLLHCMILYSRTRQREAFVWPNVVLNGLLTAVLWTFAGSFGEKGVAIASGLILFGIGLPIWGFVLVQEIRHWKEEHPDSSPDTLMHEEDSTKESYN